MEPSPNGANGGRDDGGRWAKGNSGGPGNPHARKVGQLRSAMIRAVSAGDVRAVIGALLKTAKGGDVAAARALLEYTVGKPITTAHVDVTSNTSIMELMRLADLEEQAEVVAGPPLIAHSEPVEEPVDTEAREIFAGLHGAGCSPPRGSVE